MDEGQANHLKAYGMAFWVLEQGLEVEWLLNYRGGSFLIPAAPSISGECTIRGIDFEPMADVQVQRMLQGIADPEVNQQRVKLEVAPRVAVYSPKSKLPWDDAVTLVLTYAEIPYDIVYDAEVMEGKLVEYDWLHLAPRGLYWAVWQILSFLPQRSLVSGGASEAGGECGFTWLSEGE